MADNTRVAVRRALLSVSDKSGIVDFARALAGQGIELLSTGGTFKLLKDSGIAVTEVSDYTGFPEMMDGRVKTLHPKVHGGILGRRGTDDAVMAEHGIRPIDLVVVNLYPFEDTVAKPGCTLEDAIENIDIGGPTMVRAAAKNHAFVAIVVNSSDYAPVLAELQANAGSLSQATRFDLAIKAYEHTAAYDGAIANYFGTRVPGGNDPFPRTFNTQFVKAQDMRYGENPHQRAAFYVERQVREASIATARQLQGKELSYNNIADTDAALECVKSFVKPACVIVKHANPCGVAVSLDGIGAAYELAYQTDPESAFGGIIAFNRELDAATAKAIIDRQFVEVIIAPSVSPAALAITGAKQNVRVLACGEWPASPAPAFDYKRVNGGLLVQDRDTGMITEADLKVVTQRAPTEAELHDLVFAWKVAKFVKSNAIVYAKNRQTVGIGAGQMSRVNSARIAAIKAEHAGLAVQGAVMASDAFFPFRDGIDNAAKAGIACVIQPGGSMRDAEVIAAADEPAWRWCSPACATSGTETGPPARRHGAQATHHPLPAAGFRMNLLIIGSGGREHALAWKAAQSPTVGTVFVAPGNAGTAREPKLQNVALDPLDFAALADFATHNGVGLTIVGPEAPLVAGIVDYFQARGLRCFGPSQGAAQLEGSKAFTKDFLARHRIPTAAYCNFTDTDAALAYLREKGAPIVVKADGLAAGKGVIVAMTLAEAEAAVRDMLSGNAFGAAGCRVVIEEFLDGEEASFIVMVDGEHVLPMATSQDHKRVGDGDSGPNTGGMGAYSPAPVVTPAVHQRVMDEVILPTVRGMAAEGHPYTGFLYAGLMIDASGAPKVIEYNCRFGDPETQPILMRLRSDLVALCEAALDRRLDRVSADWDPRPALGVVMAAQGYPGNYPKGDAISGLDGDSADCKVFHAGTRLDGGQVLTHGGRVLCVTALGQTVGAAQARAYQRLDTIHWRGAFCRRDIGYRAIAREQGH